MRFRNAPKAGILKRPVKGLFMRACCGPVVFRIADFICGISQSPPCPKAPPQPPPANSITCRAEVLV